MCENNPHHGFRSLKESYRRRGKKNRQLKKTLERSFNSNVCQSHAFPKSKLPLLDDCLNWLLDKFRVGISAVCTEQCVLPLLSSLKFIHDVQTKSLLLQLKLTVSYSENYSHGDLIVSFIY